MADIKPAEVSAILRRELSGFDSEAELEEAGVNIVIYANQLLRSSYPAMQETAKSILIHGRSSECDQNMMPIKEILELIPGTK